MAASMSENPGDLDQKVSSILGSDDPEQCGKLVDGISKETLDYLPELRTLLGSDPENNFKKSDHATISELEEEITNFLTIWNCQNCGQKQRNNDCKGCVALSEKEMEECDKIVEILREAGQNMLETNFKHSDPRMICLLLSSLPRTALNFDIVTDVVKFFLAVRVKFDNSPSSVKIAWYTGMSQMTSIWTENLKEEWLIPTAEENYLVRNAADKFHKDYHGQIVNGKPSLDEDFVRSLVRSLIQHCKNMVDLESRMIQESNATDFIRIAELLMIYFKSVENKAMLSKSEEMVLEIVEFHNSLNDLFCKIMDGHKFDFTQQKLATVLLKLLILMNQDEQFSVNQDWKIRCISIKNNEITHSALSMLIAEALLEKEDSFESSELSIQKDWFEKRTAEIIEKGMLKKHDKEVLSSIMRLFKKHVTSSERVRDLIKYLFNPSNGDFKNHSFVKLQKNALELLEDALETTAKSVSNGIGSGNGTLLELNELLLDIVSDQDLQTTIRSTIWKILSRMFFLESNNDEQKMERTLMRALCDTEWEIRESALDCIFEISKKRGEFLKQNLTSFILQCLEDSKPFVRAKAVLLFGEMSKGDESPENVEKICDIVRSEGSVFVRRNSMLLLHDVVTSSKLDNSDIEVWRQVVETLNFIASTEDDDTGRHLAAKIWTYIVTKISDPAPNSNFPIGFDFLKMSGGLEALKAMLLESDSKITAELRTSLTDLNAKFPSNIFLQNLCGLFEPEIATESKKPERCAKLRDMVFLMSRANADVEGLHIHLECY